ncbi:MAG: hypothetical protein LUE12_07110 [Ruminococcus sp.]|nr:hypothetical protein [Ruminococcus sp.]
MSLPNIKKIEYAAFANCVAVSEITLCSDVNSNSDVNSKLRYIGESVYSKCCAGLFEYSDFDKYLYG